MHIGNYVTTTKSLLYKMIVIGRVNRDGVTCHPPLKLMISLVIDLFLSINLKSASALRVKNDLMP